MLIHGDVLVTWARVETMLPEWRSCWTALSGLVAELGAIGNRQPLIVSLVDAFFKGPVIQESQDG